MFYSLRDNVDLELLAKLALVFVDQIRGSRFVEVLYF